MPRNKPVEFNPETMSQGEYEDRLAERRHRREKRAGKPVVDLDIADEDDTDDE